LFIFYFRSLDCSWYTWLLLITSRISSSIVWLFFFHQILYSWWKVIKKSNDVISISLNVLFDRKKYVLLLSNENKLHTCKRKEVWITFVYFCQIQFDHIIKARANNNFEEKKFWIQNFLFNAVYMMNMVLSNILISYFPMEEFDVI